MDDKTEILNISELSLEKLLELRERSMIFKEQAEAEIAVFSEELMNRLKAEKVNGMVVGNRAITKVSRYSFDVSLQQAKDLGAVKETIDNDMLKKLQAKGAKLPFKITEYVTVKEIQNGTAD